MRDFNIAVPTHTLAKPLFQRKRLPSTHNMTTPTKIELGYRRISRITDVSDLAELLFPRNRNHQHAFLVIWITLKWGDHHMVPNLREVAREQGISRRTFERVRAKMCRLGLIERVSRFSTRLAGREGWVLSTRFERGLAQLSEKMATLQSSENGSEEKDRLLIRLADARRTCFVVNRRGQSDDLPETDSREDQELESNAFGSADTAVASPEVSKSQGL
jgi:hypothetical protein